jgi:hypothetical protein
MPNAIDNGALPPGRWRSRRQQSVNRSNGGRIMILDHLLVVADTQAFGAAAVSTNSIDFGTVARDLARGGPVGFGFAIDVAGTGGATDLEIISATDAALAAGVLSHVKRTIPLAETIVGARFFVQLPPGAPTQRFLGVRVTTPGGTVSLTAWFTPKSMFGIPPKNVPLTYVP